MVSIVTMAPKSKHGPVVIRTFDGDETMRTLTEAEWYQERGVDPSILMDKLRAPATDREVDELCQIFGI